MKIPSFIHRLSSRRSAFLSLSMLAGSAFLLWLHAGSVRMMRETGLPAALALPQIERRADMLDAQKEIIELQSALRAGTTRDMLDAFVLPHDDDVDRVLGLLNLFFDTLQKQDFLLSFSSVSVGERMPDGPGLSVLPVSFEADLTPEGLSRLDAMIRLSGLLTVSDALSSRDIDHLLALTEEENPASIAALEHFLSSDLLQYAADSRPYEEHLLRSFSLPATQNAIRSLIRHSDLRDAEELYGPLASRLQASRLWPVRLLSMPHGAFHLNDDGSLHVSITLHAYVRGE